MFHSSKLSSDTPSSGRPSVTSPADAAFEAFKEDPSFSAMPAPVKEEWRGLLAVLAEKLESEFAKPATLENLMSMQVQSLETAVASGYLRKLMEAKVRATPGLDESEYESELGSKIESANEFVPLLIEQMKALLKDIPAQLEVAGVTEEQLMVSDKVGLSGTLRARYREGTLTIGDIFALQPWIIMRNTD